MKFSIERDQLRDALTAASAAIAGKSTLPILANVLITAREGKVAFAATDLDLAVSVAAPAETQTQGDATLPAKRLLEIAKQLPAGAVRFTSAAEGRVTVEGGKARFKLLAQATSEFPNFPAVDFTGKATLPGATLGQMIERVAFAASTSDSRPTLQGVFWQQRPAGMTMVATNGHKMAKVELSLDGDLIPDLSGPDVIVPTKGLELARRIFGEAESVEVARTANHIGFRSGETVVLSRLIEGPYPKYQNVWPKNNDRSITLDRDALIAAARRVAIVADGQSHRMKLSATDSGIRVSTQTPDLGSAHEDVAGAWEGEKMEIGVSSAYLLEVLKRVPTPEVRLTFLTPTTAITVETVGWNNPATWSAVIMPLRLVD